MSTVEARAHRISQYVPLLFGVDAVLLAAHLTLGGSDAWNLDREHNVPTWFAGVQLVLIGLAALQCFVEERAADVSAMPPRWSWALASGFFFYLSLDETTVIHEGVLRQELRDLLPPESLWISLLPWQVVFGPFFFVAALVLLALFASRFARSPSLLRPALGGLCSWAGAVLAEGLAKPLFMAGGTYRSEVAIEEGLELLGATLLLLSFTRYAEMIGAGTARVVELRFDARRFAAWAFGLAGFLAIATAVVAAVSLRNSAWLYRHNASQLAKRGKHADAVVAYREALARRSDDFEALRGLARAHSRLDDHGAALDTYQRALLLRPRDARLWNGRGAALHELDRFADAEASYREAIAVSPSYARAIANLGLALEKQNRREEALAEYRRALALDPRQRLATRRLQRLADASERAP